MHLFLSPSPYLYFCSSHRLPQLCPTYSALLVLPVGIPASAVVGSAKFRSRGRLPALSYRHTNGACLCRCSQPLSGVQSKRSTDDELLLEAVRQTVPGDGAAQLFIVDTRPKAQIWAMMRSNNRGRFSVCTDSTCMYEFSLCCPTGQRDGKQGRGEGL